MGGPRDGPGGCLASYADSLACLPASRSLVPSRTCQEDAGQPKCVQPSPRTAAGAVAVEEEGAELPWDGEMGEPLADEMVDEAAAAEAREAQQGEDEAGVSEERGYAAC